MAAQRATTNGLDLSRHGGAASELCPRISASPTSNFCRSANTRFDGSWGRISRPACTRRPAVLADRRILPLWWMPAIAKALGVMLDWGARANFPDDPHGLGNFDGTALYEHANPLAGPSSRLGHADLQLRPHRSGQTSWWSNAAVLAGALWHRRPARRCGRLDAVSGLQPARGRLDPEQIWRSGKPRRRSISCAVFQLPKCSAHFPQAHHGRGRNQPRGPQVFAPGRIWRAGLWLQMEYGLDARHAELHQQGSYTTASIITATSCSASHYAFFGKFHPAAVAR